VAVTEIARIRLNARDPGALANFFVGALGFERQPVCGEAERLSLGPGRLEISPAGGAPFPAEVPGWSPLFQHFAIAVSDVAAAYERLRRTPGWSPISTNGPERLPASSGGVTAFKFRGPEGHPLELISAGAGAIPRIDHSAISVADTVRSIAFYVGLGLRRGAGSINHGPQQDSMDNLPNADVEVSSLHAPTGAMHLELLAYRGAYDRPRRLPAPDDIAATRLVFTTDEDSGPPRLLRDPDGHFLQLAPTSGPAAR